MENLIKLNEIITKKKFRHDFLSEELERHNQLLDDKVKRLEDLNKALEIVRSVAKATQERLRYHVSNIVTTAMKAVMGDESPEFVTNIEKRRGKTEVDLLFKEDGVEYTPVGNSGGGLLNIASFALRVAFWSLNKNRPVLILDEPSHFLSRNYQAKFGEMLKILSETFNMQFIIVSHVPELIEKADRVFMVKKENGVSNVYAK